MPIPKGRAGMAAEMRKFKRGDLRSGSPTGPIVTNPKQAVAIGMSESGMDEPMMASMSKAKRPPKFRKKFANAGEVDQYAARPKHRVMV